MLSVSSSALGEEKHNLIKRIYELNLFLESIGQLDLFVNLMLLMFLIFLLNSFQFIICRPVFIKKKLRLLALLKIDAVCENFC